MLCKTKTHHNAKCAPTTSLGAPGDRVFARVSATAASPWMEQGALDTTVIFFHRFKGLEDIGGK